MAQKLKKLAKKALKAQHAFDQCAWKGDLSQTHLWGPLQRKADKAREKLMEAIEDASSHWFKKGAKIMFRATRQNLTHKIQLLKEAQIKAVEARQVARVDQLAHQIFVTQCARTELRRAYREAQGHFAPHDVTTQGDKIGL